MPLTSAKPSFASRTTGSTPAAASRGTRADALARDHDLSLAEQDQRDVGERREIAAAPERPVLGDRAV